MHATEKVGAGRTYENPNAYVESEVGTYKDAVEDKTDEQKFPLKELPKQPDKSPFSVGAK